MGKEFTELRSQLMQLEANSAQIRLDLELDPASLNRHARDLATTARLPLVVSRSLVLQAIGLEGLDRSPAGQLHETNAD